MPTKDKTTDVSAVLRAPFRKEQIGKLPKAGIQLDYVGHANVTDRLLDADPEWTWEPAVKSLEGMPLLDEKNGLWIKLTVGGVTRYGYGDGPDNKQRISDAIRNAAMRFGVALELWSKEELGSSEPEAPEKPVAKVAPVSPGAKRMAVIKALTAKFEEKGYTDTGSKVVFVQTLLGKAVPATDEEYYQVIAALDAL